MAASSSTFATCAGIEVDPEARTARAQTGLTALDVAQATAPHGLGIGFGDTGTVGIGGITLGGGVGYLSRRDGLTIDNLLAAEIVTADGQVLTVDAEHHPDLFWAIRGGGGNFGVATEFTYRLRDLGQVAGGMIILPATADTVAGFMAASEAAPEELTTIANVMSCPPMPFIPEELHGSIVVMGMMIWSGPVDEADAVFAPFRALATPLADMLRPMSYPEMFPAEEGDGEYRPLAVAKTMFMRSVDQELAGRIVSALESSDAPMRAVQLRVLGGAIARVPADATAYAHRSSPIMVNVAAFYAGPDDLPRRRQWVDEVAGMLDQGEAGRYVNFVGDEGPEGVRAAYPPATWERLARVKATYDPGNLFRLNQNVPRRGRHELPRPALSRGGRRADHDPPGRGRRPGPHVCERDARPLPRHGRVDRWAVRPVSLGDGTGRQWARSPLPPHDDRVVLRAVRNDPLLRWHRLGRLRLGRVRPRSAGRDPRLPQRVR